MIGNGGDIDDQERIIEASARPVTENRKLKMCRRTMRYFLSKDFAQVEKNARKHCLDKVLEHKRALFSHRAQR